MLILLTVDCEIIFWLVYIFLNRAQTSIHALVLLSNKINFNRKTFSIQCIWLNYKYVQFVLSSLGNTQIFWKKVRQFPNIFFPVTTFIKFTFGYFQRVNKLIFKSFICNFIIFFDSLQTTSPIRWQKVEVTRHKYTSPTNILWYLRFY